MAKIGDVGMAKIMSDGYLTRDGALGTMAWAAPELLLGEKCVSSFLLPSSFLAFSPPLHLMQCILQWARSARARVTSVLMPRQFRMNVVCSDTLSLCHRMCSQVHREGGHLQPGRGPVGDRHTGAHPAQLQACTGLCMQTCAMRRRATNEQSCWPVHLVATSPLEVHTGAHLLSAGRVSGT